MNELSKKILLEVLSKPTAWKETKNDKGEKVRELKYQFVIDELHGIREGMFYDKVLFPTYAHATGLLRAITQRVNPEWAALHFVWDDSIGGWLVGECNDPRCQGDMLSWGISEIVDAHNGPVWNSDEWRWEQPSKEEVLALGVKPNMVPEKVDKQGNVQASLF